jgi:hypothetical protein
MYWTLDQTTWSLGIKSRVCNAYDLSLSRFPGMTVTGIDVNSFEKFDVKRVIGPPNSRWVATRLGLATLANWKAAVRQRIKDRTAHIRLRPTGTAPHSRRNAIAPSVSSDRVEFEKRLNQTAHAA